MSNKGFTKKQRDLLDACEASFLDGGNGVWVLTIMGSHEHSLITARSLWRRGWLDLTEAGCGEWVAAFDNQQHSDYVETFGDQED